MITCFIMHLKEFSFVVPWTLCWSITSWKLKYCKQTCSPSIFFYPKKKKKKELYPMRCNAWTCDSFYLCPSCYLVPLDVVMRRRFFFFSFLSLVSVKKEKYKQCFAAILCVSSSRYSNFHLWLLFNCSWHSWCCISCGIHHSFSCCSRNSLHPISLVVLGFYFFPKIIVVLEFQS